MGGETTPPRSILSRFVTELTVDRTILWFICTTVCHMGNEVVDIRAGPSDVLVRAGSWL